jgi:hypothetical protein
MKTVLFVAFLALVPALADRLSLAASASPTLVSARASAIAAEDADDADDANRTTRESWPWLCGARS